SVGDYRVYAISVEGDEMMRTRAFKYEETGGDAKNRRALKIGEVSRQTGIGIETLRFYEKSGLLDRPARTESGYRMYRSDVLDRLRFIKRAQVLGFSLDEIKRLIDDARGGHSPCEEVREIVRSRLEELDQRMREMARYRKELASTLEEWDKVGRAPGHICGLIETARVEQRVKPSKKVQRKKR
ncbi:MAG TPA: heavy metal-responsive transcriptional regulator, partial [Blastocatellia bacterium]|nr:heavy metal-responsive transcriptional regulator [Blastocatellia bacterium]